MAVDPQTAPSLGGGQEELLQTSQELIQGLLETLSEAWSEIERLKQDNAGLRGQIAAAQSEQVARTPAPIVAQVISAQAQRTAKPRGEGVLIIDDSKLLQMRLRGAVESLGYLVVGIADDGESGLKQLAALNPRLVILDYLMPGMNGLECLREIRQIQPDVKVIVCSAQLTTQISRELIYAGVNEILIKPIQHNHFNRAVQKWMGD